MKIKRSKSMDGDLNGAFQALKRAATRARQLAEETGTPFYIVKDGCVVDLNVQATGAYSLRESGRRK